MSNRERSLWWLEALVVILSIVVIALAAHNAWGDSTWYAVAVDTTASYGDPRTEIVADSTGLLYTRAVWYVEPGTWRLALFAADSTVHFPYLPFTTSEASSVLVEFPVMDSTGVLFVGAGLRVVP